MVVTAQCRFILPTGLADWLTQARGGAPFAGPESLVVEQAVGGHRAISGTC
jgi:hypothetical protein